VTPDKLVEILNQSTVKVFTDVGWGTGFFISSDTLITNKHVIENQDVNSIYITSKKIGDTPIKVEVVASTNDTTISKNDYAVLKVKAPVNNMVPLKIGSDPTALLPVIAAGFPGAALKYDENTVTPSIVFSQGEVSVVQVQSLGPPLIIHTANISPGSSGGPLVNRCGQLVGVNTFGTSARDEFDSRQLYSLAASSLKSFLKQKNIAFNEVSTCSIN
jgi:S1-C subfamily serine protease